LLRFGFFSTEKVTVTSRRGRPPEAKGRKILSHGRPTMRWNNPLNKRVYKEDVRRNTSLFL
jgi:hypothetical protein